VILYINNISTRGKN